MDWITLPGARRQGAATGTETGSDPAHALLPALPMRVAL